MRARLGGGRLWVARGLGGLAGLALAGVLAVTLATTVWAQQLVADLSSHLIAITTGFTGTEVVLFGTTDGVGDVAIVVTGPKMPALVRRKERVLGMWMNTRTVHFSQAPSFYSVATSRPLDQIVSKTLLERQQIGVPQLTLAPQESLDAQEQAEFRDALIRNKRRAGVYTPTTGTVSFLGDRLFRTNLYFPANVPTGLYNVEALLIRNGEVVSAQTTPLVVSKIGFSAEVYDMARHRPITYGVLAVLGAVAAGWTAGAAFRRV